MSHQRRDEVQAAVDRYRSRRDAIERGERPWHDLAELFTEDAVYIDPAWGRVEGREAIASFIEESMTGLDGWSFPIEFIAIEGDTVVIKWTQILPGTRPDGGRWTQSGYSTLVYAGDGLFSYEEDLMNMVQVIDDLRASGWRPGEGFTPPPPHPDRNVARQR